MGTLVFDVFGIWLIVAAVLVNKFGNGGLRIGSLSLDQTISVLSGASFTFAFVHLLTSAPYWHVGAYLAFFAAVIAVFAGVFTMIPFFGKEFALRDDVAAHPKARPVSKRSPHPAPIANMPGANHGPGGFGTPYGGQPNGPGQPNGQFGSPGQPGGPGQFGQPGQQAQPGQQGQPGQYGGFAQSGPAQQFAQPGQYGQPSEQDQFGGPGQPDEHHQFGQPIGSEQNSPYARPEPAQESSFDAPDAGDGSGDQGVQSTGSGQTYIGAQHSQDPEHSQSEPTQTFGFGAQREESPGSNDGETAVQAPVPSDHNSPHTDASAEENEGAHADSVSTGKSNDDSFGAGATAAVAGAGIAGAGATVGAAAASSESESRRGRHAAPDSPTTDDDESVSPAESSSFASKVNAHDSDTNARASEGVALKPEDGSDDSTNLESTPEGSTADEVGGPAAEDASGSHRDTVGSSDTFGSDADESDTSVWGANESDFDRTAPPENDEPTQYVPVASYGSAPEAGAATSREGDSGADAQETVSQSRVGPGSSFGDRDERSDESSAAAGHEGSNQANSDQNGSDQSSEQKIIQAFWFAVPEPREAVDATTGMPVFTIYPGDWFLGLEDNGSWFKVRDNDGREGILRNTEGVQRG